MCGDERMVADLTQGTLCTRLGKISLVRYVKKRMTGRVECLAYGSALEAFNSRVGD